MQVCTSLQTTTPAPHHSVFTGRRHTHPHTRLTALCPGLPGWAGTRKAKQIWILLKQETVSGTGISWAICKSAPRSRQITTPAPHHSVFYRPDALPATQPTVSKHWRRQLLNGLQFILHRTLRVELYNYSFSVFLRQKFAATVWHAGQICQEWVNPAFCVFLLHKSLNKLDKKWKGKPSRSVLPPPHCSCHCS